MRQPIWAGRSRAPAGSRAASIGARSPLPAAECTANPRERAEVALAHAVGSSLEQTYQRGDQFEKRRKLIDAWARFCTTPQSKGKVVQVRGVSRPAVFT